MLLITLSVLYNNIFFDFFPKMYFTDYPQQNMLILDVIDSHDSHRGDGFSSHTAVRSERNTQ